MEWWSGARIRAELTESLRAPCVQVPALFLVERAQLDHGSHEQHELQAGRQHRRGPRRPHLLQQVRVGQPVLVHGLGRPNLRNAVLWHEPAESA